MQPDTNVYPDGTKNILNFLKQTFYSQFKAFYDGDPILIPDAALPCVIVEKLGGQVSVDATGTDSITEVILIKLVMNKHDDIGATPEADLTEKKLRYIAEARDANTGYFLSSSLMYVLRTNITLGGAVIDSDIDISYDVNPRPEAQYTSEAHITVTLRERVIVPNRV